MQPLNFTTKHLLTLVIALTAGICYTPYTLLSIFIFSIALFLSYKEKQYALFIALICCFFFFGSTRYHQNRALYFTDITLLEKKCNIIATVQEVMPRLDEEEQFCITLQLNEIELHGIKHLLNKKIYLFLPSYTTIWIKPHQVISIKNITLKHPCSNSYEEHLIRENIWAVAHQNKFGYTTIENPSIHMQQMDLLRTLPLLATKHNFSELTKTLYLSIFCGKKIKSATTTHMKKIFQCWGISHHLARSGLHLVILISLLSWLFSLIPCSSSKKQLCMLTILFVYYATTYSSIAFMRAFYMYIFYTFCKQLELPSNSVHILLITSLLILSCNPHHLFFLDFQLSFGITLLILWFCQTAQNIKTVAS